MRFVMPVVEVLAGTTLKSTWANSGVTPSAIYSRMMDAADTMVSSFAAVSSGNGLYYGVHTMPSSPQWMVNEWNATIDGYPYINRQLVRVRALETD